MRGKLHTAARLLAIGALAVLMSGCMKLQMDLTVNTDETVSGSIIFAVDKQLLSSIGQTFDDITQGEAPLPSDVTDVQESAYEDDTFTGKQYEFSNVPLEKFNSPEDPESLNIVRSGDTYTVSGTLDLSQNVDPTQPGMQAFIDKAEISVSMTFPGKVESSNGQIDGNTVTWTPTIGESTQITAVASAVASSSSSMLLWIGLGIAAVVVIVIVVVLLSRKGKGGAAPASGFEGTTEAMPPAATEAMPPAAPEAPPAPPAPPAVTEPEPPAAPEPAAEPAPETSGGDAAPSDDGDTTTS